MATVVRVGDPLWINRALSARDTRIATAALLGKPWTDDRMEVRPGILPDAKLTAFRVVPTTGAASMAVRVSGGHAVVTQPEQGPWIVPVETTIPALDVPPPDPTNPRIDLVVLRVYDLDQGETAPVDPDPGGRGVATIEIVKGDASGIPAPPPTPVRSLLLATIRTTPQTTVITAANITERRVFTVPRGGVRPAGNALGADALPGYIGEVIALPDGTVGVGVDDAALPYRGVQAKPRVITQDMRTGPFTATEWVATLNIADPGYPYQVDVSASVAITIGQNMRVDILARLDSPDGPLLNAPSVGELVWTSQQNQPLYTARFLGAPFTHVLNGAHNVCLIVAVIWSASGAAYSIEQQNTALSARVFPYVGP
jgi:hypothetical protein